MKTINILRDVVLLLSLTIVVQLLMGKYYYYYYYYYYYCALLQSQEVQWAQKKELLTLAGAFCPPGSLLPEAEDELPNLPNLHLLPPTTPGGGK